MSAAGLRTTVITERNKAQGFKQGRGELSVIKLGAGTSSAYCSRFCSPPLPAHTPTEMDLKSGKIRLRLMCRSLRGNQGRTNRFVL